MRLSFVVFLLVAAMAGPLSAQAVPVPRSDFDEAAAQYRGYALGEFNEVVNRWVAAVNEARPEAAGDLYTDDAYLEIEGPARGRAAVETLLRDWTRNVRHIQVGLSDFDASGNMSYGTLQVRVTPADGTTRSGTLLLVLRKLGRSWQIRAQTLTLF